ncbi:MAG: hypothetical protein HY438_04250 [DPANN group archaeon]|nr:hypothetical protein [DPANN group archaeon]
MSTYTINAFQEKAYELYLQRVYTSLKAPGFKLSFEKLRELVGGNVEVHGKEMFMPAPWHDVYACIALLQQAGLVSVSKEPQFVVIKASVTGGQKKFKGLLSRIGKAGNSGSNNSRLPASSIETVVEAS